MSFLKSKVPTKLSSADCSRGAPMGRRNIIDVPAHFNGAIYLQMLPINNGGYDQGGVYWGSGDHRIGFMYRAYYWDGEGHSVDLFLRAVDRRDAKQKVQRDLPKVRFYR